MMSLYKGPTMPPGFWENLRATMTRNQEAQWAANKAARLLPPAAPTPPPPPVADPFPPVTWETEAATHERCRYYTCPDFEDPPVEMDGPDYRYPVTRWF